MTLGKTAAVLAEKQGMTLTDAVIKTVGAQKLSNEQLHRVVEHTNHEAFHRKFANMDPTMRVVNIEGGPADPTSVVARLGETEKVAQVQEDLSDYRYPPMRVVVAESTEKVAQDEPASDDVDIVELLDTVKLALDELQGSIGTHRYAAIDAFDRTVRLAKQACAEGAYLEDFEQAWGGISPQRAVEILGVVEPPMAPVGVKVAARTMSPEHPLMLSFHQYVKEAHALKVAHTAHEDMEREFNRLCKGARR